MGEEMKTPGGRLLMHVLQDRMETSCKSYEEAIIHSMQLNGVDDYDIDEDCGIQNGIVPTKSSYSEFHFIDCY
jgi:hypothetical protein